MKRLPLVLSATAVLVSILGSTSLGQAAGNAVGQSVEKAKATAGLARRPLNRPDEGHAVHVAGEDRRGRLALRSRSAGCLPRASST